MTSEPGAGPEPPERTVLYDRYELRPLPIARGGMGEVWEGHDTKLDREVAVKFVRFPDGVHDKELVRRFVRESRITARLQHPGVPAVFDVGAHEGRPFLIMQRVHGISVSDLVAEQGPLPVGWAVALAAQTCSVLSAAHKASLVHRDLKPGNLMLEPDGTVKVLDFGLAVALDLPEVSQITRSGQTIGTPAYMAPEQVLAAMSTPQSDLYALGCTLHEMLTGRRLFSGSTAYTMMNKQVAERPPSVRRARPDAPPELAELIAALLEKKPEDRPASANTVYERLLPLVADLGPLPGVLHPPTLPSPVRMYATVLSRTFDTGEPPAPGRATPGPEPAPSAPQAPSVSRGDLARVRADASSLARASRYSQAAEVLASAVDMATAAFGALDSEVLSLRLEWADVLFEGGDYHGASPVYASLATDLAKHDGADERAFRCRLKMATCHALTGDTTQALDILRRLLDDERRVYGPDDLRPLELRRQIGLLQLGAGQRDDAERTLRDLHEDLLRGYGPEHPTTMRVRETLDGLDSG